MATSYPVDFPVAEGLEIVTIVRQGQVKAKLSTFSHRVWVLQGFAQKVGLGNPEDGSLGEPIPDMSLLTSQGVTDPVDVLEKVCEAHKAGVTAQFAVPWALLLKWALGELLKLAKDLGI